MSRYLDLENHYALNWIDVLDELNQIQNKEQMPVTGVNEFHLKSPENWIAKRYAPWMELSFNSIIELLMGYGLWLGGVGLELGCAGLLKGLVLDWRLWDERWVGTTNSLLTGGTISRTFENWAIFWAREVSILLKYCEWVVNSLLDWFETRNYFEKNIRLSKENILIYSHI